MNMKKLDYLIRLTYDKNYKGYVADVVNLYGCMSQGKTKKEALENLEFITEQTTLPEQQKKKSISKKVFYSLKELINSSSSLITI